MPIGERDHVGEVAHEAALADTRVTEQQDELCAPPAAGDRERVPEHPHLRVAPDERAAHSAAPSSGCRRRV